MNAVLLYSEVPKGMKSYGSKAILPIGKQRTPLIIKQIRVLQKKCNKIYIVIGFDKIKIIDTINKYKCKNIEYIDNNSYNTSNDAEALRRILEQTEDEEGLLVIHGGVLLSDIEKPKLDTIFYVKNPLLVPNINGFDIGLLYNDKHISYLFYETASKIWSEIIYLNPQTKKNIKKLIQENKIYMSMFLFECINVAIDNGIVFDSKQMSIKTKKINHYKNLG